MSVDEGVSRFIGRLYESVYDADGWRSAIAELMTRTGSRLAFIIHVDVQHREYSRSEFYAPETSVVQLGTQEYFEEMYLSDPSLIWASGHADAGVCDTSHIMSREDFGHDPT